MEQRKGCFDCKYSKCSSSSEVTFCTHDRATKIWINYYTGEVTKEPDNTTIKEMRDDASLCGLYAVLHTPIIFEPEIDEFVSEVQDIINNEY